MFHLNYKKRKRKRKEDSAINNKSNKIHSPMYTNDQKVNTNTGNMRTSFHLVVLILIDFMLAKRFF